MMNDERRMMNKLGFGLANSSFILPHSSFIISSSLPPLRLSASAVKKQTQFSSLRDLRALRVENLKLTPCVEKPR
jgi:hypothetical protein